MNRELTQMERAAVENADGESVNPKDLLGVKKPALRFVPPVAIGELSKAMALGAQKYGPFNWREKRVMASIYYEAAQRHLMAWFDGENLDPESRASHLSHVMACCAILLDAERLGRLVDDRPEVGGMAEFIAEFQQTMEEHSVDEVAA